MPGKPEFAAGYSSEQFKRVRATCLYVATRLGDLLDEVVIVGGLVPSLLIPQTRLPKGAERHVGTMDLDVGLALAILDQERYKTLTERLRKAGFTQDKNAEGRPTRQRWKIEGKGEAKVTVDFLIPPARRTERGGTLRSIEKDFAALITEGLPLAFRDREKIRLSGKTLFGEKASREVWVCGPGGFVVLKALAFRGRGEGKDAYDLFYVLRNYGKRPDQVGPRFSRLLDDPASKAALSVLEEDFSDVDGLGPKRAVEFLRGRGVEDLPLRAAVVGFVQRFLRSLTRP